MSKRETKRRQKMINVVEAYVQGWRLSFTAAASRNKRIPRAWEFNIWFGAGNSKEGKSTRHGLFGASSRHKRWSRILSQRQKQ